MSRLMKLFEILRQAPKDRKLEGKQVEKKSEAARTKLKKLIRRTCFGALLGILRLSTERLDWTGSSSGSPEGL